MTAQKAKSFPLAGSRRYPRGMNWLIKSITKSLESLSDEAVSALDESGWEYGRAIQGDEVFLQLKGAFGIHTDQVDAAHPRRPAA